MDEIKEHKEKHQVLIDELDRQVAIASEALDNCCAILGINRTYKSNPSNPQVYNPVVNKINWQISDICRESANIRGIIQEIESIEPAEYKGFPYKLKEKSGYIVLLSDLPGNRPIRKKEHRHVMELKAGLELPKTWVVHHIDEDKSNNHPDNLKPMPKADHTRYHSKKRAVSK